MKLLLGRVFSFHKRPQSITDKESYLYMENGGILVENGRILAVADGDTLLEAHPEVEVIDHRPNLLMPGFIDTHIHFPQVQVIGSYGAQLLDWLNTYTFPAEMAFADDAHCARMAEAFLNLLTQNGTTSAVAHTTSHIGSAEALFQASAARNMNMIAGKTCMDRNAPAGLCDTPQRAYDESKALMDRWHGKGRAKYAITPRFAITSSPEQLEAIKALHEAYPDCYLQTHLSENLDEIRYTMSLYPDHQDYLGIYEDYGFLGERTLMGHSIHLSAREIDAMAVTKTRAIHCPTSNLFIGSGLFPFDKLDRAGVPIGVATDIGGGTSYSMLTTMAESYKIQQLQNDSLNPLLSFFLITKGNAEILGLDGEIGSLEVGHYADIVVLDKTATDAMHLRAETIETLEEELFVLQMMGDDRAIVETYVAGKAQTGKARKG